jgi:hypothetical protein
LKNQIIIKRIEYFKNYTEDVEDAALLQTIKIPKNLLFLSDKLPQPNYEKHVISKKNHSFTKKNQNDLPDIRVNPVKQIRKVKEDDPTISPKKRTQGKENMNRQEDKRENSPKADIYHEHRIIKNLHINLEPKKQIQYMPIISDLPQVKTKKKLEQ